MDKLVLDGNREIKLQSNESFRGWDAADELILAEQGIEGSILVLDDSNGALTCGLQGNITSYCSDKLNENNINSSLTLNGSEGVIVTDFDALPEHVDYVVIKLPKFIDLLEYYIQIVGKKYPGAKVIVGGMVKYMPITMVRLMEEYFTDVTTSLTKKKARLIYGTAASNNANPTVFPKTYKLDDDLTVASFPGVFSSDHLDIGTRFLKEHIPSNRTGTILDLGCGSGILGLTAKKQNPEAEVVLTDLSYLSIDSAKESFKLNNLDGSFHVMDCLKGYESDSVDIVLCNPPFHQGNRVVTDVAIEMFKQSRKVLKRGGSLIIVANKHLGYHKKLRDMFHNLKKVAENEKFFIYLVRKV